MKVALFNVKYSPNLGDGLLSECLEQELRRHGIDAFSIDLAGRTHYRGGSGNRGKLLATLEAMPSFLRSIAARSALSLLAVAKLRPGFRRRLHSCDAVIVGGGNLFADADLNFPIKIHAALGEAGNRPAAVFGVGVADNWSATGKRLFRGALTQARLIYASVRDERSRAIWQAQLAGIRPADIVRDPGLLASRHYPRDEAARPGKTIGLCITDPVALRYHGGHDLMAADMDGWYGDAIAALTQAGWHIRLFTNGSPEDRDYLNRHLGRWLDAQGEAVTRAADFTTPGELVHFITGCDLLIAHRMHACIAAHSFAVPTLSLKWDPKLDSFADIAGRMDYLVDPALTSAQTLADLAARARDEGVDPAACAALIDQARADVAHLAGALKAGIGQAG